MKCAALTAAVWAWAVGTALAGGTGPVRAGYNIDFNLTSGTGAGLPANTFGAAAAQPGIWNSIGTSAITSGATFNLLSVDATAIATARLIFSGTLPVIGVNNANTSGDHEKLLDDILNLGGVGTTVTVSVQGLAPGVYEVYTYAGAPDSASYRTDVALFNRPAVSIGGAFPVNGFTEGVTHARQRLAIGINNDAINITLTVPTVAGVSNAGSLAGIQIKPLNPTRLYVKATAVGTYNDGLSWETALAFTSLGAQIAGTTPSVTEVWAARTTTPNSDWPVAMRNGLAIYGGFLGTETTLAARTAIAVNSSTLSQVSGDPNLVGSGSLPHVVVAEGTDATAVIDGFWIKDGVANGAAGSGNNAGGGLYATDGAPTIRNCRFTNNSADFGGGGLYISRSLTGPPINATVNDCYFLVNTGGSGGAVRLGGTQVTAAFSRCWFTSNNASAGSGGAVYSSGELTMTNCLVAQNSASFSGAGVYTTTESPRLTMVNCTVARNNSSAYYGGVRCTSTAYTVHNSIFYGNTNFQPMSLQDKQFSTTVVTINQLTDSIVQGWDGTLATAAFLNFDGDPLFVNAPTGNYRLAPFSPAIDTGWNGGFPGAAAATDLEGNPRVFDDLAMNNAGYGGGTIDRGCIERQAASAPCIGDIGRTGGVEGSDGVKDNNDLVVFIAWFFGPDSRADVGRTGGVPGPDGTLDNNDFIVYIDMFFGVCP